MDNAVGLVEAYLNINGYFTVTEYPIVESLGPRGYRTVTDLDVLAVRFPGAGRLVPSRGRYRSREKGIFAPDPVLQCPEGQVDMLIGEVKEGRAELNRGARDPEVLKSALVRFGCCAFGDVEHCVDTLMAKGNVELPSGHRLRLVAFGTHGRGSRGVTVIRLQDVLRFISSYLDEHWDLLKHADFKTSALGFLTTLRKATADSGSR